jgi:hypothetical protein
VVAFDDGEIPYFIATSTIPNGLKGSKWNGSMFDEEIELTWADLRDKYLRISHYYGTAEVTYTSIYRSEVSYKSLMPPSASGRSQAY